MTKQTWITSGRLKKSGCNKLIALAAEIGKSDKTLQRWGIADVRESAICFDKFAKLFGEDEAILRKSYWKVRKANGYMNIQLGDDTKARLKEVTAECHAQQLLLNTRNCKNKATEKLVQIIVGALEKSEMKHIVRECNQTLAQDIKKARPKQLEVLRSFISEIAKASMHVDEKMLDGGSHALTGRAPVWLIQLLIDSSEQLDFYQKITVVDGFLDNDSIPHLHLSSKTVGDNQDSITHYLIYELNKKFRPTVSEPPCYNDDPIAYENYCGDLNAFFVQRNNTEDHKFCTANKNDVHDLLLKKCEDLRIYETETTTKKSAHSRFDDQMLGAWLALHLGEIIERNNTFSGNQTFEHPPENNNEKENNMTTVNVNVENKPVFTQSNNQTNSPQWQQFHQAFDALSQNIQQNTTNPNYRDLKNAVRDIQEQLDETNTLHKDSQSWLEKSLAAISHTDSAWGLAEKTIKAIALLNGAGIA